MVGAPVSADVAGGRAAGVLSSNETDVGGKSGIDYQESVMLLHACMISMSDELTIVVVDRELAGGRVTGHILVDEGKDGFSGGLVVGEDSLGTEKAALLTGVEVELEGVLGLEAGVGENAESLKDDNDA